MGDQDHLRFPQPHVELHGESIYQGYPPVGMRECSLPGSNPSYVTSLPYWLAIPSITVGQSVSQYPPAPVEPDPGVSFYPSYNTGALAVQREDVGVLTCCYLDEGLTFFFVCQPGQTSQGQEDRHFDYRPKYKVWKNSCENDQPGGHQLQTGSYLPHN